MFLHRIKILTLAGFTIWIDVSWLILAVLLIWTLALGEFPRTVPNLSASTYWWMGFAGTIGLFISIILHELSHALIARRYDMPIAGITLFIFGGVAELHKEPSSAKAEFLMAIGGPIASMVLGTILLLVADAGDETLSPAAFGVLDYLGALNWILALFNLIPAFPLDGGRVLRAGLWGWMSDFGRATRIAAASGEFFGIAMILYGILEFITGNIISGVWLSFIGLFLHGAAGAARRELALRRTFGGLPVSTLMQRNPIGVAPDLSIAELVEDYFYRYYFKAFPVLRDGELIGCIMAKDVRDLAPSDAAQRRVADVMRPCSPEIIVPPHLDALEALVRMQGGRHSRLLVVEQGRLLGVLALSDMLQYLSLKQELDRNMQDLPWSDARTRDAGSAHYGHPAR
ncbi:site-2 protease family protein [Bradyrhizobium diazoefficiens]|nr:site-2 protease family protein [Bradyrhizobium diazoefficiens]QQO24398.1 site-2 protease family protein [Bradyrhizobium diazoefficiens]